jgi:hypothetical protein
MASRFVAIGLAAVMGVLAVDLKEFTSERGGFSVLLPGTPTEEKVPIKDPKYKSAVQYQFTVGEDNGAYLVSYQDNPGLAKANQSALEQALISAQKRAQTSIDGQLVSEKKIKLQDEFPGREFTFELPAVSGAYRSRMYLVKGRLYQVIVVGTKEFAQTKDADKVLESFKLAK